MKTIWVLHAIASHTTFEVQSKTSEGVCIRVCTDRNKWELYITNKPWIATVK